MPNPAFEYKPPQVPWLDVCYQDEALLIVNKPPGLLSVPGRLPEHQDALSTRLQGAFPACRVVHRLDMATSGLMVFALSAESHRRLSAQFERREVKKRYVCRVLGQPHERAGTLKSPLICDWPERPKQKICWVSGKTAVTHFRLAYSDTETTLLFLYPVTGRSHQLRVHMQHFGFPILGDRLYAPAQIVARSPRLCLHAQAIVFRHPFTEEPLHFSSHVPFAADITLPSSLQDTMLGFSK